MDDLISRQTAIDALGEEPLVWNEDDAGEVAERNQWKRDVAAIKALPSAERRGRWIPVTERLPAYGEEVLLSTNGDCRIGYLVPTYDERQYEWHHLGFFYFFNEIDAWMPLPEPYKGGEEK